MMMAMAFAINVAFTYSRKKKLIRCVDRKLQPQRYKAVKHCYGDFFVEMSCFGKVLVTMQALQA